MAVSASIALISSADETPISLGQPNSGIAEIEAIENGFITIDDRLLNQADDDIDNDLDAIGKACRLIKNGLIAAIVFEKGRYKFMSANWLDRITKQEYQKSRFGYDIAR